ncbi:MAG: SIS domain-containing protein [Anaerolineaceae bacterium]|nr:SIS domain-containing protein [Anaerolineaceae bacterium]
MIQAVKPLDRDKYLIGLQKTLEEKDKAAYFGKNIAAQDIRRIYFIACGAPNREMHSIKYWIDLVSKDLETALYYPAEFVCSPPARLDQYSLVILMSHSGSTREVLEAAKFLEDKKCHVAAVTMHIDAPLAKAVPETFVFGSGDAGYEAKFIILMALISGLLQEMGAWDLHAQVMQGLDALPAVMADAEEQAEQQNADYAAAYADENFYMVLGSGPSYATAYSLGVCVMMESLWVKVFEGQAAEFFHGPFEIVDEKVPVILFLGEDNSRPIAERTKDFLKTYTNKALIYDSRDYAMNGIPEEVRAIMAPYVTGAASIRFAEYLSAIRGQPLSTRRYMGKVSY